MNSFALCLVGWMDSLTKFLQIGSKSKHVFVKIATTHFGTKQAISRCASFFTIQFSYPECSFLALLDFGEYFVPKKSTATTFWLRVLKHRIQSYSKLNNFTACKCREYSIDSFIQEIIMLFKMDHQLHSQSLQKYREWALVC